MKRILPFAILLAAFSCTTAQVARTENSDSRSKASPIRIESADELAFAEPAKPETKTFSVAQSTPAESPGSMVAADPESAETPDATTETAQVAEQKTLPKAEPIPDAIQDDSAIGILADSTQNKAFPAESPQFEFAAPTDAPFALTPDSTSLPGKKPRFLPMRRRMDREINKIKYVRKGEIMFGLTASYGTLDSDDTDLWLVIDDIKLNASIFTVNPFVGYFFRDNMAIGARFGYSQISGDLASASLNLGETNDINFGVNDITVRNKDISFGLFLRSYAGLDAKGHFGLFGELELSMSSGSSEFGYRTNGELRQTFGDNTKVKLSFNPGMAVYIFPNVCSTISFGLGGLQYVKTTQKDGEGNRTGSRTYSNLRFRLNLADIRIGLTIHMWNKKKSS